MEKATSPMVNYLRLIGISIVFSIFIFAPPPTFADRGVESHPGARPSGGDIANPNRTTTNTNNTQQQSQQIQNALDAFGEAMQRSAKEQAERERRSQEQSKREEEDRLRNQQIREQERARKQQLDEQAQADAIDQAQKDPSLNPFGNANSHSGSAFSSGNDSTTDLTGQACRWLVVTDADSCGSRLCFYSEGQTVALGMRAYRCRASQWALERDCNQSTSEIKKKECQRDIIRNYGLPGSKETPAQNIYQKE